jgi:hypothetical protein
MIAELGDLVICYWAYAAGIHGLRQSGTFTVPVLHIFASARKYEAQEKIDYHAAAGRIACSAATVI